MSDNQQVDLVGEDEIPCMLLPMNDYFLLVPTVTVAEMAPVKPLADVPDAPDWLMGMYEWRDMKVPVMSIDTLNGDGRQEINREGRIAVLNNTGVNEKFPFIALHTQGIPRMARVGSKDIEEDTEAPKKSFNLMAVKVGLESFIIPDVSALENVLTEVDW